MIFYPFIEKTNKYLKSVRILKNYVSFDMAFPTSWVMLKTSPENIEILQNENNEGNIVTSFVCQNNKDFINSLEKIIDNIIKTNFEREEKERLFKMKVKELQNIFEKEKLDSLKSLKFDIEEYSKILNNETESEPERTESGV
jgi:ATP-dependent Lon protease